MSTLFGKSKKRAKKNKRRRDPDDDDDDDDEVELERPVVGEAECTLDPSFMEDEQREGDKYENKTRKNTDHKDDDEDDDEDDEDEKEMKKKETLPTTTTAATSGSNRKGRALPNYSSFEDLGLTEPLVRTCYALGFKKPTPVQRAIIPFLLREREQHVLAVSETGSGKTASFVLPVLHHLVPDPHGIYAVVLTPTRELAKQVHQQVVALGSSYDVRSALVVGGMDPVRQSLEMDRRPHFVVSTPGRLAELLRGCKPPDLRNVRYMILDEADRLLTPNSGFERDVAELLLHGAPPAPESNGGGAGDPTTPSRRRRRRQTLLFSATMTRSLESVEEMAGAGRGRLPLRKFVITDDDEEKQKDGDGEDLDEDANPSDNAVVEAAAAATKIPAGLKQEYIFMPSRVRDAYLVTAIRSLMINEGRVDSDDEENGSGSRGRKRQRRGNDKKKKYGKFKTDDADIRFDHDIDDDDDLQNDGGDEDGVARRKRGARSAIVFVSTCERAAFVSGVLSQLGVDNVALHSLLSQNRRLASLEKFKSRRTRVMVATDVASRGLDIPAVDLVLNSELPRNPVSYVHRVGRTARAGRRGRAASLVSESDVALVHAAERASGRPLEKCPDVTDDAALPLLGPVAKASRLTKMHLADIGFDGLVQKFKERKERDRKERRRIERALKRSAAAAGAPAAAAAATKKK